MTERESQYPFEKNMDWCSKNSSLESRLQVLSCFLWRFLLGIPALTGGVVGLAIPGGKGGGLAGGIQVRNIAEAVDPEGGDALAPFFRGHGGHWGGGGAEVVPQHHGGDVQQMPQQDTLQAEVAEEDDGFAEKWLISDVLIVYIY